MPENLKIMPGEDYIRRYGELNLPELEKILPAELINTLKKRHANAQRLKVIHADTRRKFNVVLGGIGDHTAAFINTLDKETFIGENTLADQEFSLHAARHEQEHAENGVFHLDLNQLNEKEHQIFKEELKLDKKLDQTTLIEGFNELSTFKKHGHNEQSGYAQKEVPLAEKLEKLAQKYLKTSLLQEFQKSQVEKFLIMLKNLAVSLEVQRLLKPAFSTLFK